MERGAGSRNGGYGTGLAGSDRAPFHIRTRVHRTPIPHFRVHIDSDGRWGQEPVKKCRFANSAEAAVMNLSFRALISNDCDVGIHFGSLEKFLGSISSHVPDGKFPFF